MSPKQKSEKSKLLKLKEWMTIPETATYLATIFEEDIKKEDVLRMGLDGHLQLSIYFVNGVKAMIGKFSPGISLKKLKSTMSSNLISGAALYPPGAKKSFFKTKEAIWDSEIKFIQNDNNITIIEGVWDLPLIGNDRYDIEHEYQAITDGPEVTMMSFNGTFVEGANEVICQLQEKTGPVAIQTPDGEKYVGGFCPANSLPNDSVLVVRTQALIDLQDRLLHKGPKEEKLLDIRKERTYLNIIGALLEITTGTFKDESFTSETKLRDFIAEKFDDLRGVSVRNTADVFAAAKRALNGDMD